LRWTVVEGDFKWWARVKCLETLVKSVGRQLDFKPSPIR
jgi:polyphosphate kinase 2 (PPK2 family)